MPPPKKLKHKLLMPDVDGGGRKDRGNAMPLPPFFELEWGEGWGGIVKSCLTRKKKKNIISVSPA